MNARRKRGAVADAVIFDFDGLIVDSETPEYLAWTAVYARYGLEFPLGSWLRNVGRNDGPFDPLGPFRQGGSPSPPEAAFALWREHHAALEREYLTPLPGVVRLLDGLRAGGVRTAVASSSRAARVRRLLVYLLAARRLGTPPEACVALEDSENGVRAAKSAGMRCIAVPSALTRPLDFSAADLVVGSLTEVTPTVIAALGTRS